MSETALVYPGYVCAPYLHTHDSIELKEAWLKSKNIESLYFVTGTFSPDSKMYFAESTNHYLLAKFRDGSKAEADIAKHNAEKTSFLFNIRDTLFERDAEGRTGFVSIYYIQHGDGESDLQEIANLLIKREKIEKAGLGDMVTYCTIPPKFSFPYSRNVVVIEVSSQKSHQSIKKYCEQTRRDANRKGLEMTNMMSLSLLDRLK